MSKHPNDPTVFVVDDDPSGLAAVCYLLESDGLLTEGFASAEDFLRSYSPERAGCLLLDLRMPKMSGLELQQELVARGATLPIILMTGYGNVASCAAGFRAGAVDFLEKPTDDKVLLARIREALERDAKARKARQAHPQFFARLTLLTPREREVMEQLVRGKSLKQIALEFGVSIQTASKHRMRVLEKLEVANDIELVRLLLDKPILEPTNS